MRDVVCIAGPGKILPKKVVVFPPFPATSVILFFRRGARHASPKKIERVTDARPAPSLLVTRAILETPLL